MRGSQRRIARRIRPGWAAVRLGAVTIATVTIAAVTVLVATAGCLAINDVQTPNGDIDLAAPEPGTGGAGGAPAAAGGCVQPGWTRVRVDDRDQLPVWTTPALAPGCGAAPYRLTALAPRIGSSLSFDISRGTRQVLDATYSSTSDGADGEPWGEYVAPIDVVRLSFGKAASSDEQPFELTGSVLGPFGPVPIELVGCARVQATRC